MILNEKVHVQACLKFANDSEENWAKVLWSDETKIHLFGINSSRHLWRRRNGSWKELKTSYFGGVFLLRGQGNCTASKGQWTSGPGH